MPKRYISYEMEAMFVGPSGATVSPSTSTGFVKLDFIQSYDFSFDVERVGLKQIGTGVFASRQTQLAPDINFNLEYYLTRGWNEKFIGMDVGVSSDGYKNPFYNILTANQDRNFYIIIAQDEAKDLNAETGYNGNNILGIGNAYLNNFELGVAVNQLATVKMSFVAANAEITQISNYGFGDYWQSPAVNTTGDGSELSSNPNSRLLDFSRSSRYMTGYKTLFNGGCPYGGCSVSGISRSNTLSGMKFALFFENFQSINLSVPFERKALYGFGNNYPFSRKILKPVLGTFTLDSLVSRLDYEYLSYAFDEEDKGTFGNYDFDILFSNQSGVKNFGIKIQNAKLDSYSIGSTIGDRSIISTSWSFEINESTGILMSGSYAAPVLTAGYVTEAINL